jgi:hypothetical protein
MATATLDVPLAVNPLAATKLVIRRLFLLDSTFRRNSP